MPYSLLFDYVSNPFSFLSLSFQSTRFVAGQVVSPSSYLVSSSTFRQTFASTNNTVSSSGPASRLCSGDYANAQTQSSTSGQSLAEAHSPQQRQSSGRMNCSPFSDKLELFAQNSASAITAARPGSPNHRVATSPSVSSFFQVASQEQQQRVFQPAADVPASRLQSRAIPPPPSPGGKGCAASVQVGFSTTDTSFGSSAINSKCVSPDNFLSPSPLAYDADSPSSLCYTGSPDTADEHMVLDADSGFSDVTDKSTSPDKQQQQQQQQAEEEEEEEEEDENENQTSPSKRRRVRKSRAKPHDPVQRTIVKRTRRVRANDRERSRMHGLNDAMDDLRKYIPNDGSAGKMTKIDTLRTAANYIRVLKMMLGEIEKGEDMVNWPEDMLSALNNLYVQPAASPDTTGMMSPPPSAASDDERLQDCGGGLVTGQFPAAGFQSQNCGLQDSYGAVGSVNGAVPSVGGHPMSGGFLGASSSSVSVLGDSGYCSVPANNAINAAGYNVNDFASSTMNSLYNQQFSSGSGHRSSAQSMIF